jgi:class 3 adenylate cyclase/tetratricopeptide (TPR) repeat protein
MRCPSCSSVNSDDARFCVNCGTPLAAPRPVEGERKYATVLFADVVGSTALAERLDPEEWAEVMNGAFGFMNAAVHRYGGTVGRLMGDAILAFFGAPVAHEDDPERAVRAALDLRDAARRYAETILHSHAIDFQVRIGINTGLTVLTTVGDATKAEYTAMGDTANVAARLQSLAPPDTILIGADTHAAVRHVIDALPRGEVEVRGKAEPVAVFEVIGLRPVPLPARGLEGLASPLVGRAAEWEALRARIDALHEGRGDLVMLCGDAGIGKSRLMAELRERAPAEIRWLEGRGLSYAKSVHYFAWRQVLLQALDATESDPPEAVRERLARTSASLGRPAEELAFVEAVLAVASERSAAVLAELAGPELVARLAEGLQGFVGALARSRPTVIVIDDLHWADPASVDLVSGMAEVVRDVPLLLACVFRPDRDAPSWALLERLRASQVGHAELVLGPLAESASRELLGNLLHVEDLSESVRRRILERSDGNPFFLEEVIRTLIDCGHVIAEAGRWRATRDVEALVIPDTLLGLLSARIDRLPDTTRRVAQTAAVIGRSFARRVLAAVVDTAPEHGSVAELAGHLELLVSEEFVRERTREPELEYAFKHALTQQAAYDRLLLRRRRQLHRRVGAVLERLYAAQRDDVAAVLAYHFTLGQAWPQAAQYERRAADRAFALYAVRDALDGRERALAALDRSPEAAPADVVDVILGWIDAAIILRLHEDVAQRRTMLGRLERAIGLARALDDERRLTTALVGKGNVLALSGFPTTGFEALQEAHDLARKLGDDRLFLLPYWAATEARLNHDPRGAVAQFSDVIALARREKVPSIEAHALGSMAVAHARLGNFAEARAAVAEALEVVPRANSHIKQADVHIMAGEVYFEMGEMERGSEHSRIGTAMALEIGGFECACSGSAVAGSGKYDMQQFEAARGDFERAMEYGSGTMMEVVYLHHVRGKHAATRFKTGDQAAVGELEMALAHAERVNDDYAFGTLSHALADAYHQLGRLDLAERHVERALASFRANGLRPYVARALATQAAIFTAAGRDADAAAVEAEAERLRLELQAGAPMTPTGHASGVTDAR